MGSASGTGNGKPAGTGKETWRAPRRIVVLASDEQSEVAKVLAEFTGNEGRDGGVHQQIQKLALQQRGRWVAAEWLGPLGWTRFLWCRK